MKAEEDEDSNLRGMLEGHKTPSKHGKWFSDPKHGVSHAWIQGKRTGLVSGTGSHKRQIQVAVTSAGKRVHRPQGDEFDAW